MQSTLSNFSHQRKEHIDDDYYYYYNEKKDDEKEEEISGMRQPTMLESMGYFNSKRKNINTLHIKNIQTDPFECAILRMKKLQNKIAKKQQKPPCKVKTLQAFYTDKRGKQSTIIKKIVSDHDAQNANPNKTNRKTDVQAIQNQDRNKQRQVNRSMKNQIIKNGSFTLSSYFYKKT